MLFCSSKCLLAVANVVPWIQFMASGGLGILHPFEQAGLYMSRLINSALNHKSTTFPSGSWEQGAIGGSPLKKGSMVRCIWP